MMTLTSLHDDTFLSDRWPQMWGRVTGIVEEWVKTPRLCVHGGPTLAICVSGHGDREAFCLGCLDRHHNDYFYDGATFCLECGTDADDLRQILHEGNRFAWTLESALPSRTLRAICVYICDSCEARK